MMPRQPAPCPSCYTRMVPRVPDDRTSYACANETCPLYGYPRPGSIWDKKEATNGNP